MRIGVISDAHGNLAGFEAALAALGPVDALLFGGDLLGYYFEAPAILRRLRELDAACILGNHDVIFLAHRGIEVEPGFTPPLPDRYRARYGPSLERATAELSDDDVRFLAGLATRRTLELDGLRVLLCHGSPWRSVDEYVYPDSDKLDDFAALDRDLVVMGHTHRPFARQIGAVTVVNAGSCGQPRDGDTRAAYVAIDTATSPPTVSIGRAAYDRAPLLAACRALAPDVRLLTDLLTRGDPPTTS